MGFLNFFLLTPFILNLTCPSDDSDANFSVQYDLLQRVMILSPFNSNLKSPGVRFPWGASGVMNQLCLSFSNSSRSSGFINCSKLSPEIAI